MANQTNGKIYDVIVIGGGISGMSGAKYLHEKGVDVLVLEARDRVGGRTYTVQNPKVDWVDLGGAYIGRTQNHVLRLIDEFKLELYPVNEKEKLVYYGYDHSRALFNYDQQPNLPLLDWLDLNYIFRLMDKMGEEIPADAPWLAPKAELWDQMTFKEFVEQHCRSKWCREFMRVFVESFVTVEMHESSLLWFLWYVKQCGGSKPILATTNGGQEFKVKGGTNQISIRIADKIGRDRVLLEHPVCYLEQSSNNVEDGDDGSVVTIKTLSGDQFRARYVIMATPPAVQQKIHYQPGLPPMRNQLIQRTPMGSVLKCIVYYKTTFWRNNDMCGTLLLQGEDCEFPISYTLDDTKFDGARPAIVGFIPADKARKLIEHTKEERLKLICESYAKAFACDEARHPIHYEEQNWMAEQYSGGCYTMTCQPGFLTLYGPYLRKPIGRMHFAGTETASCWSGYINGGVQAGERAAREILHRMGRIAKPVEPVVEPDSKKVPPYCWPEDSLMVKYAPSANGLIHGLTGTTVLLSLGGAALWFAQNCGFGMFNTLLTNYNQYSNVAS